MSNPFVLAVMAAFRGKLPRPPDKKSEKQKDTKTETKQRSRTRAYREG